MNDLPWFKFHPSICMNGDVQDMSLKAQGLFSDICALYWIKRCDLTEVQNKRRHKLCDLALKELTKIGFVRFEDDKIRIPFLDQSFVDVTTDHERNATNQRDMISDRFTVV